MEDHAQMENKRTEESCKTLDIREKKVVDREKKVVEQKDYFQKLVSSQYSDAHL